MSAAEALYHGRQPATREEEEDTEEEHEQAEAQPAAAVESLHIRTRLPLARCQEIRHFQIPAASVVITFNILS